MEIIVLLKQVPSTESIIRIGEDGKSVNTDNLKWVMNPYDEFAVEEAIRIREKHGGTVTIVSVGRDKTVEAIRTGLAMGGDKGVLVKDPVAENCDGVATARILAALIREMPYDIIIAGCRAVDDDSYLVGSAVAELLDIPGITMVTEQEITDGVIRCRKDIDGGTVTIESDLPALITAQRGLNEPRYASLPGIMKAKKKPIDMKTLADIGIDASDIVSGAEIVSMSLPPERKQGKIIEGDTPESVAAEFVRLLHEEAKVV